MMLSKIQKLSNVIVLPHSIFALPFALAALLLSFRRGELIPSERTLVFYFVVVSLAVFFARTTAMAFNRLIDLQFDKRNPRTRARELAAGTISKNAVSGLVVFSASGFFATTYVLGWHCFLLSPIVLFVLLFYSFTKRFTVWAHMVLGVSLALAPGGAWWVLRPTIEATPLWLMFAVLLWVAGFDVLYSLQDIEFDRQHGLFSIPAKLGMDRALQLSSRLHALSLAGFLFVGWSISAASVYYVGITVLGFLLFSQHIVVSPLDQSRIDRAFFTLNGFVSLGYLGLIFLSS